MIIRQTKMRPHDIVSSFLVTLARKIYDSLAHDEEERDKAQGLQRPMNLGYRQQVRTECCLQIHAMNRSSPNPYPPCGDVPYLGFLLAMA